MVQVPFPREPDPVVSAIVAPHASAEAIFAFFANVVFCRASGATPAGQALFLVVLASMS